MTIDKIFVIFASIGGIIFTYWFFLMKKEKAVIKVGTTGIDIVVKGGYSPEVISISKGKTTTLNFIRRDPSSCLEDVVIPDFKIRKYLPMNEKVSIPLTPKREGSYEISCGMNMFHGKIIVK